MTFWDLANNPLFIANWRERFRPSEIFSRAIVVLLIIGLIFCYVYFIEATPQQEFLKGKGPWQAFFIFALCVLEGYILLFFGTMSAYSMASREVSGGTLDFHRVSPTPSGHQVLGLCLGAVSVEWVLFGCIFILQLCVMIFSAGIFPDFFRALLVLVSFHLALGCCAFLYNLFGVLAGLMNHPKRKAANAFVFVVILYFLSHLLLALEGCYTYHLTWFPAYAHLSLMLESVSQGEVFFTGPAEHVNMFFGVHIPPPFLQFLIQTPFIIFLFRMVQRRITKPEHPLLSKPELLLLIVVVAVFHGGSTFFNGPGGDPFSVERDLSLGILVYLLIFLGYAGVYMATPSYLLFMKGWKRVRKLGQNSSGYSHDHSSNFAWLICYSVIVILAVILYGVVSQSPLWTCFIIGLFVLTYPWFFGQILEYFNLSRHHRSRIIMLVVLLVLWVFIPLFGYISSMPVWPETSLFLKYGIAPSPFFGLAKFMTVFRDSAETPYLLELLSINIILTVFAGICAGQERQKIKSSVVLEDNYLPFRNIE